MYKKIGGSSSPNRFGASMADLSDTMLHSTHSDFVLHEPPLEDLSNSDASAASSKPRVRSLDAFRGLVMVVMIFVDDTGSTYGGHWDHSPWDNITFADFVMPYFLFIVGVSSIYAHDSKNVPGNRCSLFFTTLWRCVKLFLIGLLLQGAQNFGSPYDLSVLRIPGILQRIAWAQIVVTLFEVVLPVRDIGFEDNSGLRYYRRFAWHWVACLTVLVGYALLMYTTSVPGCPIGSATPECNAAGYWDTKILGHQHMYGDPTYRRLPECSSCLRGATCRLIPKALWRRSLRSVRCFSALSTVTFCWTPNQTFKHALSSCCRTASRWLSWV
jgi:heparan-alpha-glucosaminide N-acetyltransferase